MKTPLQAETAKVRTTLYLTPENKQGLGRIPGGQKTALMNRATANALKELKQKENGQKFIEMITQIKPVNMNSSSDEIVRQLREGKDISSAENQSNNE